ncbi:MAG: hypothetical protein ACR2QB_01565 [Gammaproteobacteria bacterium]
MSGSRPPILILLIVLLVTGCAKGTKLESTQYEKRPTPKPFSKIVVVGITPNQGIRVRWEDLMARTLRDGGNTAWASFRQMGYDTPLSRDTVAEVVRATGADAVLVSRLIRQDVNPEEVEARSSAKVQRKSEYLFDFFRYDYKEVEEPAYTLLSSTVEISSDVYETTEGRLIYSLDSVTYDKATEWDVLDTTTTAIAKRLRKNGMMR